MKLQGTINCVISYRTTGMHNPQIIPLSNKQQRKNIKVCQSQKLTRCSHKMNTQFITSTHIDTLSSVAIPLHRWNRDT